ncbi:MAG: DUF5615 family PIN-like protein [Bacteroidetes bacterium]|nr:DUF5615 family PIN-like protein [Bacteroidota bacterium]
MLLLLDENLPKKLKHDFLGHQTFTIREKGWTGVTNGNLLKLMAEEKFDALITFDQNLQHQQNFKKHTLTVFVLVAPDNSYLTLKGLVPKVLTLIGDGLVSGPIEVRL